jgi:aspartyl-tRNA synthetase
MLDVKVLPVVVLLAQVEGSSKENTKNTYMIHWSMFRGRNHIHLTFIQIRDSKLIIQILT